MAPNFIPISGALTVSDLCSCLGDLFLELVAPSIDTPNSTASVTRHHLTQLCWSSSSVTPGSIFVAIKGSKFDGHQFVAESFKKGAAVVVVERNFVINEEASAAAKDFGGVIIRVSNTSASLARLAANLLDNPQNSLALVGVTGTNGKTTTNWLIYHLLLQLGRPSIRIGTLGAQAALNCSNQPVLSHPDTLTTPAAPEILQLLSSAKIHGCEFGVLEVSSHALDQERVAELEFSVGIFTNLTRDHLDYHSDMEHYFGSKLKLFGKIKEGGFAVIRVGDYYGDRAQEYARNLGVPVLSYGLSERATCRATRITQSTAGLEFDLNFADHPVIPDRTVHLSAALIGEHNVENITAALLTLIALGFQLRDIRKAISHLPQVPGRLEQVGTPERPIYVDYAHTPDALERVLRTLKPLTKGELWVLVGCGGDRDRGKRPQMGKIASELSDRCVITSDNPRSEDPAAIIAEILPGIVGEVELVEVDRALAIRHIVSKMQVGDVALIAGKGHEQYQIIGTHKHFFSDQAVVREALTKVSQV